MQKMLNFLQTKYIKLLSLLLIVSFSQTLDASKLKSCDYRVFSIKTTEKVSGIELLSQIADSCDFSLVIKDNFAKTTLDKDLYGINIKNLSLDDIFEVIISDNDLYYNYNRNFLRVSALKTKSFKVDYITSVRTGSATLDASLEGASAEDSDNESISSSTNNIASTESFDFWSTMAAEVTSVLNAGSEDYQANPPIINQNAGLITVTGTKKQLDRIEEYLKTMRERLHRQVLIDVSILTVDLEKNKNTGIDWSKFQLGLNSNTNFTNNVNNDSPEYSSLATVNSALNIVNNATFSMEGVLNFLRSNGDTQVVSNPKVLTLNNQQALITIGDTYNYKITTTTNSSDTGASVSEEEEIKSLFVGVLLNITPQITDEGEIILRINPSVSELKDQDIGDAATRTIAPDTTEKKLSTVVKVHDGNTIILGGLITTTKGTSNSKVPILGDVPVFGYAFNHEKISDEVQELIFIITPRIIGAKDKTKQTLKDLGFSKKIYEQ